MDRGSHLPSSEIFNRILLTVISSYCSLWLILKSQYSYKVIISDSYNQRVFENSVEILRCIYARVCLIGDFFHSSKN